jgi:hypothetical protein
MVRSIFAQHARVLEQLEARFPSAAELLDKAREDRTACLAFLAQPGDAWAHVATSATPRHLPAKCGSPRRGKWALRNPTDLERHDLRQDLPFEGQLFLRAPFRRPPWVQFVESGTVDLLGVVPAPSASAVLFLEAADRWFAYVFGHGAALLRTERIEPDFGLKVALNSVAPDRLRSVDMHTMEELTLHTSRQLSRSSSQEAFGIDITRDVLRVVTGEPHDPAVARRITGRDGLAFADRLLFEDLGRKAEQFFSLFQRDDYREHFAWVDNLRWVKDAATIDRLDQMLLAPYGDPKPSSRTWHRLSRSSGARWKASPIPTRLQTRSHTPM